MSGKPIYPQRVKNEVIRLAQRGNTQREIQKAIGVSKRTIGEWTSYELDSPWGHSYCRQCGDPMSWRIHPLHPSRKYLRCFECAAKLHQATRNVFAERLLRQQMQGTIQ